MINLRRIVRSFLKKTRRRLGCGCNRTLIFLVRERRFAKSNRETIVPRIGCIGVGSMGFGRATRAFPISGDIPRGLRRRQEHARVCEDHTESASKPMPYEEYRKVLERE